MNYKGTVKNGVVVLPPEAKLSDGAEVEVITLEARADDPPFLQAILKLAMPRDWPEDLKTTNGSRKSLAPSANTA